MRRKLILCSAIVAALAGCSGAPSERETTDYQTEAPPSRASPAVFEEVQEITCNFPIKPGESAQSILERFGKDARRDMVMGGEGEMFEAVVLWPEEPGKRLEVSFNDEAMNEAGSLRPGGDASNWIIAGLKQGTPLANLQERNGKPFEFYGFGWDYGGLVFDWKGGALEKLDGECSLGAFVTISNGADIILPNDLIGDRAISSENASLNDLDAEVSELWIVYPE